MDLPITVKCLRRRCKSSRDYVALRPCPVRVPRVDPSEAPTALLRPHGCRSASLRDVRLVDGRWFEPLHLDKDLTAATPADLSAAVRASIRNSTWGDWPFAVPRETLERGKVEAVRDADLDVVAWDCDYDALAGLEAGRLSTTLALVGGALFRTTRTPELLVKVEADASRVDTPHAGMARRPVSLRMQWGCQEENVVASREGAYGTLSTQRWSPANAAAAERFVAAYSGMTRTRVVRQDAWDPGPVLGLLARDDMATHDADMALTLRSRNECHVGRLRTGAVRAWLAARDAADAGHFARLPDALTDLAAELRGDPDPWARAMLARIVPDLLRIALERPGAGFTVGGHGASPESGDGHALGGFSP